MSIENEVSALAEEMARALAGFSHEGRYRLRAVSGPHDKLYARINRHIMAEVAKKLVNDALRTAVDRALVDCDLPAGPDTVVDWAAYELIVRRRL